MDLTMFYTVKGEIFKNRIKIGQLTFGGTNPHLNKTFFIRF